MSGATDSFSDSSSPISEADRAAGQKSFDNLSVGGVGSVLAQARNSLVVLQTVTSGQVGGAGSANRRVGCGMVVFKPR